MGLNYCIFTLFVHSYKFPYYSFQQMAEVLLKYSSIALIFFFITGDAESQKTGGAAGKDSVAEGKALFLQDERIPALVKKHKALNQSKKGVPGFRVQLFFGSHKQEALDTKGQFLKQFPDRQIYLLYEQPYFKLRVGDFLTRLEALKVLNDVLIIFPNAFVVKDDVMVPELE